MLYINTTICAGECHLVLFRNLARTHMRLRTARRSICIGETADPARYSRPKLSQTPGHQSAFGPAACRVRLLSGGSQRMVSMVHHPSARRMPVCELTNAAILNQQKSSGRELSFACARAGHVEVAITVARAHCLNREYAHCMQNGSLAGTTRALPGPPP